MSSSGKGNEEKMLRTADAALGPVKTRAVRDEQEKLADIYGFSELKPVRGKLSSSGVECFAKTDNC